MKLILLLFVFCTLASATCTSTDSSGCPSTCTNNSVVTGSSPTITLLCPGTSFTSVAQISNNQPLNWMAAWPSGSNPATIGILVCIYGGGFTSGQMWGCPGAGGPASLGLANLIIAAEQTGRAVYVFNYSLQSRCKLGANVSIGASSITLTGCPTSGIGGWNMPSTTGFNIVLGYESTNEVAETFTVTSITGGSSPTALGISPNAAHAHTGGNCTYGSNETLIPSLCNPILFVPMQYPRQWQDVIGFFHFLGSNAGTASVPGNPFNIVNWGDSAGGTYAFLGTPYIETQYATLGWTNASTYTGSYRVTGILGGEPDVDFGNSYLAGISGSSTSCGNPSTSTCDGTGAVGELVHFGAQILDPSTAWTNMVNAEPITYYNVANLPPVRMNLCSLDLTLPYTYNESAMYTALTGAGNTATVQTYSGCAHDSEYCTGGSGTECANASSGQHGNPYYSVLTGYPDGITWINALSSCTLTPLGALPTGTVGVAYSQTLTANNCASSQTFSLSGQPSGISISTSGTSGIISGTPTASGNFTVTVNYNTSEGNIIVPLQINASPNVNGSAIGGSMAPGSIVHIEDKK